MQSPSSSHNPPSSPSVAPELSALADIVAQVQVAPTFQICHSNYPSLNLPDAVVARYRQLPLEFQRCVLRQKLRDYLYDLYFSHEPTAVRASDANADSPLQNDQVRGVSRDFYAQLHEANRGNGYVDHGWRVRRRNGEKLSVCKDELTLQISPQQHLQAADRSARVGDAIAIRLPKNRLENGFYMAVGNAGMVSDEATSLEIYFNVSATGAIALMRHLTHALNTLHVPFTFKTLYNLEDYRPEHRPEDCGFENNRSDNEGRYDAGVLNLPGDRYATTWPILKEGYEQVRSQMGSAIPLLTKPIAEGIGLAEEPDEEPHDFGLHRCQMLADGLLSALDAGDDTPEGRVPHIIQQFHQRGIDLQRPYLNPTSTDCYPPLT